MSWRSYKDLKVWQKAIELTNEVYSLTKNLPPDEKFGLVSQMRRAAVSIASNIAEGQARQTNKDFKHFLSIARGSVAELDTQLLICTYQGYLSDEQVKTANELLGELSKMLTSFINKLSD